LTLCRSLIAAGMGPDRALEVYRCASPLRAALVKITEGAP
jgi:hypothetical protein